MTRLLALTRRVSPALADCALSYIEREPIDLERAEREHDAYEATLRSLGVEVLSLPAQLTMPDSVFVEDPVVVTDELAVLTAPRLPSRRIEVDSMAEALAPFRQQQFLQGDATLEGGDVMRIGRDVYVGRSHRTNEEGIRQLAGYLEPFGYRVRGVPFTGCLHLKTACTYVGTGHLLANPEWVDTQLFGQLEVIPVAPTEEMAGNALLIGDRAIMPDNFPATRERLEAHGIRVVPVEVTELQKAEAGVTCCSVLLTVE